MSPLHVIPYLQYMKRLIESVTPIISLLLLALVPLAASAFPAETYAPSSVLSSGKWVKVKVNATGLYLIPASTLQSWGFADMSRVRVFGYGGEQISDVLSADNYVDDLPVAPMEVTERGVVFFGRGPVKWEYSSRSGWSHAPNYYSMSGYYFVTDAVDAPATPESSDRGNAGGGATSFTELLLHESELVSGGATGHTFLGEDFSATRSRNFEFELPDRADDKLSVNCSFATCTVGASTKVELSLDGEMLPSSSSNTIAASGTDNHRHYVLQTISHKDVAHAASSGKVTVGVTANCSGTVRLSRLDYIEVSYRRHLKLNGGSLLFRLDSGSAVLSGAGGSTRLWDVTDMSSPVSIKGSLSGSSLSWSARSFIAIQP